DESESSSSHSVSSVVQAVPKARNSLDDSSSRIPRWYGDRAGGAGGALDVEFALHGLAAGGERDDVVTGRSQRGAGAGRQAVVPGAEPRAALRHIEIREANDVAEAQNLVRIGAVDNKWTCTRALT